MVLTWRGTVAYRETLEDQRRTRDGILAGTLPPQLWGLEHLPVITTGRRDAAVEENKVRAAGYDLVATERGGLATCHEPGQLVGYLLFDCSHFGVRRLVSALEATIAAWLGDLGLPAGPREGHPGVWVGRDKVAALGLHVKRGVTMHGFALNLTNDLRGFSLIIPCGIADGGVSSVARLLGHAPSPEAAWPSLSRRLANALDTPRIVE